MTGEGPCEGALTVIETIMDPTVEITADGGTVDPIVEDDDGLHAGNGAVLEYFLVGPVANPPGANPGVDAMREAYLSIGDDEVNTLNEGDTIADRDAVDQTVRRVPVNNGTGLDLQALCNCDNAMHYAWTQVTVSEDTQILIGASADDSIQVLVDGVEVLIQARSGGGNNNAAQWVTENQCAIELTAGTHTILMKVFEGGGGHNGRIAMWGFPSGGVGAGGLDCASATEIAPGEYGVGCTVGADVGVDCNPQSSPAHYYVVEGTGEQMTVQTCQDVYAYDTYLAVFDGTCDAAGCVGSNDDTCGRQSLVSWPSVAGETYYVSVYGWGTSQGTYVLKVSDDATPPANVQTSPLSGPTICADPDGDCDVAALTTTGYTVTFETDCATLADAGVSYTLAAAGGAVTMNGEVVGQAYVPASSAGFVLEGTGPIGPFDNAHYIGVPGVLFPSGTVDTGETAPNGLPILESQSGGRDIWTNSDEMEYAYTSVTGDFVATLYIDAIDDNTDGDGHTWARAGLMARQSCHYRSRNVFPHVSSGSNLQYPRFQWRDQHEATGIGVFNISEQDLVGYPATGDQFIDRRPQHIRLTRVGDTFTAEMSYDDPDNPGSPLAWNHISSHTYGPWADSILIGAAVGGHGQNNGGNNPTIMRYTFEVGPFEVEPLDCTSLELGAELVADDYDDGTTGIVARSVQTLPPGGFTPGIVDGRMRLTDQTIGGTAAGIWYETGGDAADGFVADVDIFLTKDGLPGDVNPADGMTIAFRSQDAICTPIPEGDVTTVVGGDLGPVVDDTVGVLVGTEEGEGRSTGSYNDVDDVYTTVSATDKDIWTGGDDFYFQYTEVEGDFDIMADHDPDGDGALNIGGGGRWGKAGLMARQLDEGAADRCQRLIMAQGHVDGQDAMRVAGRRNHGECNGGQYEITGPVAGSWARFQRISRRGDTFYVLMSHNPGLADGTLDPADSCNWQLYHTETWADAPESVAVGYANCKHDSAPDDETGDVTVGYRLLAPDPGATGRISTLIGCSGGSLGFAGCELNNTTETHPSFAIEADIWVGGGNNEVPGAGSNQATEDEVAHFGLDLDGWVDSVQTNADFGVATADLPNLYDPAGVHMTVQYLPDGQVDVWVSQNAADGEPAGVEEATHILSARIKPLPAGPYLAGATAGTGGATVTTEIDNYTVSAIECVTGIGPFIRGDCNDDGAVVGQVADAVFLLSYNFTGGPAPNCLAACDANGDGAVVGQVADAIYILGFNFLGGPAPVAPFPECGTSAAESDLALGCEAPTGCE